MTDSQTDYPFPALTTTQRYHFEVNGYVVIEKVLTENETGRLLEAMYKLKQDFLNTADPTVAHVRNCYLSNYSPNHLHFAHILETDPAVFDYLTKPRLVGMAAEIVGGDVRLEESEAIINKKNPLTDEADSIFRFHAGTTPDIGTYTVNNLHHCTFVKTLTNLTDLGPEDGGTVCIAGSHKVGGSRDAIIAAAYGDQSLIHQITAPAGSTMLFGESLIHATGHIHSNRERCIVIGGYTPTMYQAWNNQEPSPEFMRRVPEDLRPLVSGSKKWHWKQNHRSLETKPKTAND